MRNPLKLILIAVAVLALLVVAVAGLLLYLFRPRPAGPLTEVRTVAGRAPSYYQQPFEEVFGVAVAPSGVAYITDGGRGVVTELKVDGTTRTVADHLVAPSGIAIAPDGKLIVADAGANAIDRIDVTTGEVTVIAGATGRSGAADGKGSEALFNGPVGVAVAKDGTVYVADTYNDRIRSIDPQGMVKTIAGGEQPGFADGDGATARFDTPAGIAVAPDGALIVADSGNRRIRRVELNGNTTTVAGSGAWGDANGLLLESTFVEPIGVTVNAAGVIFVADAGADTIRAVQNGVAPVVVTMAGNRDRGLADGASVSAEFNRPTSVAITPDGSLLIADSANRLVRALTPADRVRSEPIKPQEIAALRPDPAGFRAAAPGRWPYEPGNQPREIAATFGELRGEIAPDAPRAHFHNGLDIPGAYGETARAVRTEKVLELMPVGELGAAREWLRLPTMGYIHIRIGRDKDDKPIAPAKYQVVVGDDGKVARVRVRRGTLINAGDAIGTLNNQNHVHLIAGPTGAEMNALAALDLPGIGDTKPPVIEENGIHLYDESWHELGDPKSKAPIEVRGRVQIVAAAYDQMDGGADRRRLGVYRMGYAVAPAGQPIDAAGTDITLDFEELPVDAGAAALVYGPGSRAGAFPPTIFGYIVTDRLMHGRATRDAWDTTKLAPGEYTLRITAADFFGNRTNRDLRVRVAH
jgi:sugar lactone lactonase YvrE